MLSSRRFTLSRQKTLAYLDTLKNITEESAVTCYLPAGGSLTEIAKTLSIPALATVPPEARSLLEYLPTGAVLFWGAGRKALILPPLPVTARLIASGYETEPLYAAISRDCTIALVLIRLGSYAIGVCRGESLVASKVGTGLVHGRHRQGGSSAGRFARHRDKQIETFLTRVTEHIRDKIEPYARAVDYIVYGGAKTTILLLQKQCPFLEQFDDRTLPPLLTVADPRQYVLEEAVTQVWSSRVIEWRESNPAETSLQRGKTAA